MEGDYTVTQTAVFCSTVSVHDTRLDILSMNEAYFPFDADELEELDFEGAVPIHNFEKFFKRKIYTYNCLAGLISYCGYIKGYEVYGDAACDPDIDAVMMRLMEELNPALQDYFQITKEDQEAFTNRALAKFRDKSILDYNIKTDVHLQESWGLPNALCHRCRFYWIMIRIRVLWNSLRQRHLFTGMSCRERQSRKWIRI